MENEVVCKLVPLYRFQIYYDEDNGREYEYVIVSDSLLKLIEAVADLDIEYSMEECRKYLDIRDFLLMPCEEAKIGYHLFDIDTHDIGVWYGADTDEAYYKCAFKGVEPVPVPWKEFSEILKEMAASLKLEESDLPEVESSHILAQALYKRFVLEIRDRLKTAEETKDFNEVTAGNTAIEKMMEKENPS